MIKLENYKIIKKIASGGMGDVYLAEHTVLENKVAIKSLHSSLVNDEDFRKRFRTEAKTQWKLSHPNIVKLIDFQERKDGLYLIMEYVEGKQLNDYILDVTGPMPDEKLIPLFKDILSAIKYAHSKGLIHRDIKPSNVLITPKGNAKIIDFGIAKSSDEDKGLTKTGVQVGTVSYMSPEQVNAEKLDKLTDIYSLGVMLFQMAVGKAPYSAQTNTFKIQLSIVSDPLPNPKEIYPSVSDKLVSIIEKATQKNKRDRFQSCDEFIKSFDKELVSKKIKSNPDKNITKPLVESKKAVPIKKKRKTSLFVYIISGLVLTVSVYYYFNENFVSDFREKLKQDKLIDEIEDRYWNKENNTKKTDEKNNNIKKSSKVEEDRIRLEVAENQAKLEKDRLAKLEKDRLANLEKDRLAKLEKDRLNKSKNIIENKNYNKGIYEGGWINGKPDGYGTIKYNNGDFYSGNWIKGKKNGEGTYKWNDGDSYTGSWVNNYKNGKGTYTYSDGYIQNGIFEDDELKYYVVTDSKGVYEGDMVDGKRNGKGTYKRNDGNSYSGYWENDQKNGYGSYNWKDGESYTGNWKNNKKNGYGIYTYSDGERWSGNWINDRQIIDSEEKSDILAERTVGGITKSKTGIVTGVYIYIKGVDKTTVKSDKKGIYRIKAKPGQTIIYNKVGYLNKSYLVTTSSSNTYNPILLKNN
ncbi:protein kinase [Flavobacteriaceae bacterium]|nr:protein kinase [Flavobacteriaceae bacterium]